MQNLLKTEYKQDKHLIWHSTNSHMSLHKVREAQGDWIECGKGNEWFREALLLARNAPQQIGKDGIYRGKDLTVCNFLLSPDCTFCFFQLLTLHFLSTIWAP